MIQNKHNKKQAIELLKEAIARSLEEQGHYHGIIEESMKQEDANLGKHCLVEGGCSELLEKMQDCTFPPSDEERRYLLNLDWNKTLQHANLDQIKDGDVRGCVSHLNRIVEHTQRIRAMAIFSDRICPLDTEGRRLFHYWAKHSSCEILYQEAVEMGLERKQEILSAWLAVMPIFIDSFAGEERNSKAERCGQAINSIQQQKMMMSS